jgi:hypothetical protein
MGRTGLGAGQAGVSLGCRWSGEREVASPVTTPLLRATGCQGLDAFLIQSWKHLENSSTVTSTLHMRKLRLREEVSYPGAPGGGGEAPAPDLLR